MTPRHTYIGIAALVVLGLLFFLWPYIRGAFPAILPSLAPSVSPDATPIFPGNTTGMPLAIPEGMAMEVLADNLPGARVLLFDTLGNLWVSQTSQGTVSLLEITNGQVTRTSVVFRNLRKPHGLAFDPDDPFLLYIAEEHRISRVRVYSEGSLEKIADLPSGSGHFTRTIAFSPEGRLYVSIGSSCNVCREEDTRRAKIFSMDADGSDIREVARGLRNSVFFVWHPETRALWATDMGRDLLGDDIPPDEVNIIREGGDFGWPICFGDNIHDTKFDANVYIRNPCADTVPYHIGIQAHSAPLGLQFVPARGGWPRQWQGDLLVAFHGSWNRSVPTGYKVVRFDLNDAGAVQGSEDFISGWLPADGGQAYGRPVDLTFGPEGGLYISDDKAGAVYRVRPTE